MPWRIHFALSVVLVGLLGCNGGDMDRNRASAPSLKDVPAEAWNKLAQKRIYFGHQSVGFNIIGGMESLLKENGQIRLNIIQAKDPSEARTPGLVHFWVGENTDPESKIAAFVAYMEKGNRNRPDIAFFKLCFVDFSAASNVPKVFSDYKGAMARLEKAFPETTFVHVTVPLTCMPTGIEGWTRRAKNLIKQAIGRPVFDLRDNSQRHEFNELMRKEYEGKADIFDLARIESTFRDGKRAFYSKSGKAYDCLVPDYTYDGGHLNDVGSKIVAEQFLILLANLSSK